MAVEGRRRPALRERDQRGSGWRVLISTRSPVARDGVCRLAEPGSAAAGFPTSVRTGELQFSSVCEGKR